MNKYKVINKPTGVTTEEAESMTALVSSLNTNPFMVVATTKIEDKDEPYQAIQYKGKVQVNTKSGVKFVLADTISEALGGDSEVEEEYVLLTSKPRNWNTKYSTYYKKSGNSFIAVKGVSVTVYTPEFEADKYYKSENDEYVLLTSEPEDWGTGTYYTKSGTDEEPIWEGVSFNSSESEVAPEFEPDKYYYEKQ